MQWWDIYVQVPERVGDAVSAYLQYLGSTGVVVYERAALSLQKPGGIDYSARAAPWTVLYGALPFDAVLPIRVCALQQFLETCPTPTFTPHWQVYCRPSPEEYLTQWQQFFRPLCIEQRLVIRPPWETTEVDPHLDSLVLDPGLAFGTGLHPTTHLCLTLLAQQVVPHRQEHLLDVGCGSGILSLAALKLGMDTVVGVDIDARAVHVAQQNAALNGLQERCRFVKGSVDMVQGQFAWIVANVYLGPLVEMMPRLARCLVPGGRVILSGVLERQEATLRTSLQAAGLSMLQRVAEAGWVALEGQRPSAGGVFPADL
jgi:ribosomal protein L11 methyltransferase